MLNMHFNLLPFEAIIYKLANLYWKGRLYGFEMTATLLQSLSTIIYFQWKLSRAITWHIFILKIVIRSIIETISLINWIFASYVKCLKLKSNILHSTGAQYQRGAKHWWLVWSVHGLIFVLLEIDFTLVISYRCCL